MKNHHSRYYFPFLYSLNFLKPMSAISHPLLHLEKCCFRLIGYPSIPYSFHFLALSGKWGEIVSPVRLPLVYPLFILIIMAIEFPGFKSPPDVKIVKIFKLQTVLFARWEEKPYKKCFQRSIDIWWAECCVSFQTGRQTFLSDKFEYHLINIALRYDRL